jgi:hypothetical protein
MRNSEAKRLLLPRNDATCGRVRQNEQVLRKTMQCEAEESRTSHYALERVSTMMQRLELFLKRAAMGLSPGSSRRDASTDDRRQAAPPGAACPRFSRIPLRSSTGYAAITASIGTPSSTGQRCAYPAPATKEVRHLADLLGAFLFAR